MIIRLIYVLLSISLFSTSYGQEQEKDMIFLRDKNRFYLGGGIGLSVYNQKYLNSHFKTERDYYKYGFESDILTAVYGKISLNFFLKEKVDLPFYGEVSRGREWKILSDDYNAFTIYSLGGDFKRYFPFGTGRHSVWGSVGAKFSFYEFSDYKSFNEILRLQFGLNLHAEIMMVQIYGALNVARKMYDDVNILPNYIFSDLQIGFELFF